MLCYVILYDYVPRSRDGSGGSRTICSIGLALASGGVWGQFLGTCSFFSSKVFLLKRGQGRGAGLKLAFISQTMMKKKKDEDAKPIEQEPAALRDSGASSCPLMAPPGMAIGSCAPLPVLRS